ncbi:hypothetical protein E1B28_008721 [Marasmius oreades]|uniref:FAR-17a/AIG1-like protein n=1 Tax=Marasmius oreades TaxID=181124 RepID=A0A9P7RZL9_9AGAR|nr:uncharacterized protein E1B28_008721 [Marasmius oreades]KAG7092362.1 hypothetical protein E1B28_008721 [Marasmius oreades]
MFSIVTTLFHSISLSILVYGYNSLHTMSIDEWIRSQYGGHFQYLTIQGLIIAGITMAASVALDLFPSSKALLAFKRALFMIAMPLATVISTVYWSLLLLVPTMILQESGKFSDHPVSANIAKLALVRIPLSVDLSLHLAPGVSLLVDFFVFERKYSQKEARRVAPAIALAYTILYGIWVEHCANHNQGMFPYPFLTMSPPTGRLAIYAAAGLFAFLSFKMLNHLHE